METALVNIKTNKRRVAFQGERGAFSEEAAIALLGSELDLIPCRTFADLFRSLNDAGADFILAPFENSISGVVHAAVNLITQSELEVLDEVRIQISQHLIACPSAEFADLSTVQSHPVALAQCRRFFSAHPQLKPIAADDTAGSVAEIMRRGELSCAAIAGQRAADHYGAVVLREDIQDKSENYTRFLLLGAKANNKSQTQVRLEKEYKS